MRRTVTKAINTLAALTGLFFAGCLIHGFTTWPTAPIRPTRDGYRDKRGNPRTPEEYARFKQWERVLLTSGIGVFVLAFAGAALGRDPQAEARAREAEAEQLTTALRSLEGYVPDELLGEIRKHATPPTVSSPPGRDPGT